MPAPRTEQRQHRRLGWTIAAIALAALVVRFWPVPTVLDRVELRSLDWRFAHRGTRHPDPRILIVSVDEGSIAQLGRWPWPRRRFAELIRVLTAAGVRAIAFDIFFADADDGPDGPASDAELVRATRESGVVYHAAFGRGPGTDTAAPAAASTLARRSWSAARLVTDGAAESAARVFAVEQATAPLPGLIEAAAGIGFTNVVDSGDGVYRQTFPVVSYQGRLYPSLALAVAAGVLGVTPEQVVVRPGRGIDLGGRRRVPLDANGCMTIDFAGGAGTYPYLSVRDLLALAASDPAAVRDRLAGRIVLVAVSAPGLYDLRASPFDTVFNGVETQANALDNILTGRFLRASSGLTCALSIVALALLAFLGLSRLRPRWAIGFAAALFVAYNWAAVGLFARGTVVEMVAPNLVMAGALVAALALRLVGEESQRERVLGALARFVPATVIERVVDEDPQALLRGQRRVVSVLFADLRDFTVKSEQMPPEQTVELLNRFFLLVQETIFEFEGTLDKYMGDGLMAFWNAPLDQPDHALAAVRTAVHLQRRIGYNRAEWEFYGMPELSVGIGISTGEAVVGYVGTGERMQYTAIGAHVNLAARLEALTKEVGARILISAATWDQVAPAVEVRPLGAHEVRGFSTPIAIYEVLDLRGEGAGSG